jgi:hypothetical protein
MLAIIFSAAGVLGGIWFGLWFMLIGGIVQFVDGVKADPTDAMDIAFGVARFIFAWTGWLIAIIGVGIGNAILDKR